MKCASLFLQGLLAVGFKRYGSEEKLAENAIMHLYEVYVRINKDVEEERLTSNNPPTDQEAKDVFRRMEASKCSQSVLAQCSVLIFL